MKRMLLLFIILLLSLPIYGQDKNKDAELSSKFIIDLIAKVKWPAALEADNFTINVVGDDKYVPILQAIVKSKSFNKKKVIINSVAPDSKFESCQMVFIATDSLSHLAKIMKKVEKRPILTVSMYPTFARYGVMVNILEVKNNEVKHAINRMTARKSNLILNEDLVKKAVVTYGR